MKFLLSLMITFSLIDSVINGGGNSEIEDAILTEVEGKLAEAEQALVGINITDLYVRFGNNETNKRLDKYFEIMLLVKNNIHMVLNEAEMQEEPLKSMVLKKANSLLQKFNVIDSEVKKDIQNAQRLLIIEANKLIRIGNLHTKSIINCVRSLYNNLYGKTAEQGLEEGRKCELLLAKIEDINESKKKIAVKIGDALGQKVMGSVNTTTKMVATSRRLMDVVFSTFKLDVLSEINGYKKEASRTKRDFVENGRKMMELLATKSFRSALAPNELAKNAYKKLKTLIKTIRKGSRATMPEDKVPELKKWIQKFEESVEKEKKIMLHDWYRETRVDNGGISNNGGWIYWIAFLIIMHI